MFRWRRVYRQLEKISISPGLMVPPINWNWDYPGSVCFGNIWSAAIIARFNVSVLWKWNYLHFSTFFFYFKHNIMTSLKWTLMERKAAARSVLWQGRQTAWVNLSTYIFIRRELPVHTYIWAVSVPKMVSQPCVLSPNIISSHNNKAAISMLIWPHDHLRKIVLCSAILIFFCLCCALISHILFVALCLPLKCSPKGGGL